MTESASPGGRLRRVAPDGRLSGDAIEALEAELGRVPTVTAVRVVADDRGQIVEVHLLATPDRSPKQLVRDVQSVALASLGIEVDYRKISVVQLGDSAPHAGSSAPERHARPQLERLTVSLSAQTAVVEAVLRLGTEEVARSSEVAIASVPTAIVQTIASAVCQTVGGVNLACEHASTVLAGDRKLAVATVRVLSGRGDEVLVGAAPVRHDVNDAFARAALDALNRILGRV